MSAITKKRNFGGNLQKSMQCRAALSVCVALSLGLIASGQSVDAKSKSSRSANKVQIAALPFFKKDPAASKEAAPKAKDAKAKDEKPAAPIKEAKAAKKKDKDNAVAKDAKKNDKAAAADAKVEPAKEVVKEAKSEAAAEKAEEKKADASEEKAPAFLPDASLISVLKDLSKALKDPEQVGKLSEEANQQAVISQAQMILGRSLENSELTFNRIISTEEERQVNNALTPESWASGEVAFADGTGSLTAVWAKRVNGLLNLTVAGNSKKSAPNGKKIGNFVVVITGRSPIEAGFDIQTQSNVNFWLGQLATATIDSDCLSDPAKSAEATPAAGEDNVKKKSLAALPILVTDRVVAYKRDLTAYETRQKLLAEKAEQELKAKTDERNQLTAQAIAEATAKVLRESTNRSLAKDETLSEESKDDEKDDDDKELTADAKSDGKPPVDSKAETKTVSKIVSKTDTNVETKTVAKTEPKVEAKPTAKIEAKPAPKVEVSFKSDIDKGAIKPVSAVTTRVEPQQVNRDDWNSPPDRVAMNTPTTSSTFTATSSTTNSSYPAQPSNPSYSSSSAPQTETRSSYYTASTTTSTASPSQSGWESPAIQPQSRQATLHATIVLPEKAVAGQFLTTSIIDKDRKGEPAVELSFNGAALATDGKGQALYMVPEDATPGRSLNVSLASRPEMATYTVDILQPLSTSFEAQIPKIDKMTSMVSPTSIIIIEGHNFDGKADHNRVLIDGFHEARVIASSPVQLKAMMPAGVKPGTHSLCVGNAGRRSNSATCELIAAEVQQDPKEAGRENLSKLVVKVIGTSNRVNVKITNNSPDVLRIARGNETTVTTTGGANNSAIVGVQRLKKGAYNVEAVIEQ